MPHVQVQQELRGLTDDDESVISQSTAVVGKRHGQLQQQARCLTHDKEPHEMSVVAQLGRNHARVRQVELFDLSEDEDGDARTLIMD